MKCIVTESGAGYSKISEELEVGSEIYVLPYEKGRSIAQNKLLHAILQAIYKNGGYSFASQYGREYTFSEFKEQVKIDFGEGFEYYKFKDENGFWRISKKIPEGQYSVVVGFTKSTRDYTVAQMRNFIDNILKWCYEMDSLPDWVFKKIDELMRL